MKTMKKLLFLVMALVMVLSATAFAATVATTTTYRYDNSTTAELLEAADYFLAGKACIYCEGELKGTAVGTKAITEDCTKNASIDIECQKCHTKWVGATTTAVKEHNWGTDEVVTEDTMEPTCITAGKVTKVVKCQNTGCKATKETVTENTPAAYGHDLLNALMAEKGVNLPDYDASKPMTKDQAKAIEASIKFWNDNYKTHTIAEEKEASWRFQGEHLKAKYVAPDACEAGYIKIWCDYCDKVLFEQEFAGEHDWDLDGNIIGAFPTCDTPGEIYVKCTKCHEPLKVYLPAYGHLISYELLYIRQGGELVAYTSVANVDNAGKIKDHTAVTDIAGEDFVECEAYQLVRACELPKLKLDALTIYIEGYVEELFENIEINGLTPNVVVKALIDGLTNVQLSVSKCDHIEYAFGAKILPALWDHVYDLNNLSVSEDPNNTNGKEFTKYGYFAGNCYEPWHYYLRCNGCEKWTDKVVGAEPAHNWEPLEKGEVTKKATCSANGEIKLECLEKNCEGTTTVTTDKLDHQLEWHHTGSCRVAGKLIEQCNVCLEITQEIDVKAWHDPSKRTYAKDKGTNVELVKTITKGGTEVIHLFDLIDCTKDGEVKYTCGVCNQTITEKIDKTGHSYNVDKFVEDLKDGKLQKNNVDYKKVIPANSDEVIDNKFDSTPDGIIEPTCSTYGYVYLQCTNPNCTQVAKIKYAEKLNHFDKIDEDNSVIVESTCTEKGTETKVCLCGYTETVEKALAPHTPTKIDGKDVCVVCGTELKMETEHKFEIQTTEMKVSSTSVSGRGVISRWESFPLLHGKLFARINYNFTLDNGETVAYVACVPVDMDGSFRAASPSCPYGATLTNVAIMITTDADAQDKVISDVVNMGIVVVK